MSVVAGLPVARHRADTVALLLIPCWFLAMQAMGDQGTGRSLGGYPLCEASAAAVAGCPGAPDLSCLVVGDNEQPRMLFTFIIDRQELDVPGRQEVNLKPVLSEKDDFELADIEAMASFGSGEILIYGSHGRKGKCKRDKKRRRFVGVTMFDTEKVKEGTVSLVRTRKSFDLHKTISEDASGELLRLREAIEQAEQQGDTFCDKAARSAAFNIEGAVSVPGLPGEHVWLGLRAPLVDGLAALVRQRDLAGLDFDRARLIDLGGRGIRGITYKRGWIWGLAGPVDDTTGPSGLWRIHTSVLAGTGVITPTDLGEVPNGSEGLVVGNSSAFVVIDGDAGESGSACRTDSTYVVVDVPW